MALGILAGFQTPRVFYSFRENPKRCHGTLMYHPGQSGDRKMIPVRNVNDSENTGDLLAYDQEKTEKAFY